MDFLRKVYDNEVYAQSISSKVKVTVSSGSKNISVSGTLRMRKDDVIRIQLTPFGLMEAGRLEFTKDYVLMVDRINKEYVKASYADVDFLKANGLDFYALQALFRNTLFVPGAQKITESSLRNFDADLESVSDEVPVTLKRNNMTYVWTTGRADGRINKVNVVYRGQGSGATAVDCTYGAFKSLGAKKFPTDIKLSMRSDALKGGKTFGLGISAGELDTSGDWEARTEISDKYRRVSVETLLGRLTGM